MQCKLVQALQVRMQAMNLNEFLGSGHPQNAPEYRKSHLPNIFESWSYVLKLTLISASMTSHAHALRSRIKCPGFSFRKSGHPMLRANKEHDHTCLWTH